MAARHPALQAATRLRQALEQSAAALGDGRLDVLLGGEAALQDATILSPLLRARTGAASSAVASLTPDDRHALREELQAARRALVRCRFLGANLNTFVRISLDAHGRAAGYDPQRTAAAALGGRDLNIRA